MAYTSNASGQREVYVRAFPSGENEIRISTAGGEQPRWRGDGQELYYVAGDGKMMAVSVSASKSPLKAGVPVPLFDAHLASPAQAFFNYDVTADGKRFLVDINAAYAVNAAIAASVPPLTVIVNWNARK